MCCVIIWHDVDRTAYAVNEALSFATFPGKHSLEVTLKRQTHDVAARSRNVVLHPNLHAHFHRSVEGAVNRRFQNDEIADVHRH